MFHPTCDFKENHTESPWFDIPSLIHSRTLVVFKASSNIKKQLSDDSLTKLAGVFKEKSLRTQVSFSKNIYSTHKLIFLLFF